MSYADSTGKINDMHVHVPNNKKNNPQIVGHALASHMHQKPRYR